MKLPFLSKSKGETAIDPVCKMTVDIKNPPGGKHDYKGTTYYFCSPGCRMSFQKTPEKFLAGAGGDAGHMR